jgi:hypothetical protein
MCTSWSVVNHKISLKASDVDALCDATAESSIDMGEDGKLLALDAHVRSLAQVPDNVRNEVVLRYKLER